MWSCNNTCPMNWSHCEASWWQVCSALGMLQYIITWISYTMLAELRGQKGRNVLTTIWLVLPSYSEEKTCKNAVHQDIQRVVSNSLVFLQFMFVLICSMPHHLHTKGTTTMDWNIYSHWQKNNGKSGTKSMYSKQNWVHNWNWQAVQLKGWTLSSIYGWIQFAYQKTPTQLYNCCQGRRKQLKPKASFCLRQWNFSWIQNLKCQATI